MSELKRQKAPRRSFHGKRNLRQTVEPLTNKARSSRPFTHPADRKAEYSIYGYQSKLTKLMHHSFFLGNPISEAEADLHTHTTQKGEADRQLVISQVSARIRNRPKKKIDSNQSKDNFFLAFAPKNR